MSSSKRSAIPVKTTKKQVGKERQQKPRFTPKMEAILYLVVFVALIVCGVLFQDMRSGMTIIAVYGLVALFRRIPSIETFKIALVSMLCVPILLVVKDKPLAGNFAQYAFLFIFFGAVSVLLETWQTRNDVKSS